MQSDSNLRSKLPIDLLVKKSKEHDWVMDQETDELYHQLDDLMTAKESDEWVPSIKGWARQQLVQLERNRGAGNEEENEEMISSLKKLMEAVEEHDIALQKRNKEADRFKDVCERLMTERVEIADLIKKEMDLKLK